MPFTFNPLVCQRLASMMGCYPTSKTYGRRTPSSKGYVTVSTHVKNADIQPRSSFHPKVRMNPNDYWQHRKQCLENMFILLKIFHTKIRERPQNSFPPAERNLTTMWL